MGEKNPLQNPDQLKKKNQGRDSKDRKIKKETYNNTV